MTIRNRLSYLFTGIVAATILGFSAIVYLLSENDVVKDGSLSNVNG